MRRFDARLVLAVFVVALPSAALFAFDPALGIAGAALLLLLRSAGHSSVAVAATGVAIYAAFPPYIGIEVGSVVLFWQRLIVYAVVGAAIAHLVLFRIRRDDLVAAFHRSSPTVRTALLVILLIALWRMLAEAVNGDIRGGLASLNELVAFLGLATLAVGMWSARSDRRLLYIALSTAAGFVAMFCLYEYVTAANPLAELAPVRREMVSASEQLSRYGRIRATATLGQPLAVGQLIVLGIGALHALPPARATSFVRIPLQLVMIVGLVATGTRSALVALVFGVLFTAIRSYRTLGICILVVAVFTLQPFLFRERLDGIWRSIEVAVQPKTDALGAVSEEEIASRISALSRVAQLVVGIPVVASAPVFGVGMLRVKEETGLRTIDNYYLLTALESGVPVLCGFTVLCFLALRSARRLREVSSVRESDGLFFAIVASMVMLLFVALKVVMPLVFLTLGLTIGAGGITERRVGAGNE